MAWRSVRRELRGEIMNTDILCEISYEDGRENELKAQECLGRSFELFRDFEQRYSRFIVGNELWQLNISESQIVSEELFDLLEHTKVFYEKTNGVFDPSILPVLEGMGYIGAYANVSGSAMGNFSSVVLDRKTRTVQKPRDLFIDLGGIGKGYIIDKVVRFLDQSFENFLVDAGGDIFVRGENQTENYSYWAISVENPVEKQGSIALLLLKDMAVATSGRNRRKWNRGTKEKHHLIDATSRKSSHSDLLTVTTLASSAVEADVLAKTLFLSGEACGKKQADIEKRPTIFVNSEGRVTCNRFIESYVWKA